MATCVSCTAEVQDVLGGIISHEPEERCNVEGCDYPCKTCGLFKLGIETVDIVPDVPILLKPLCAAARLFMEHYDILD